MPNHAIAPLTGTDADFPPRDLREFHFTDGDFARVRELIYRTAGIALSPVKRDLVYGRLARRLRVRGLTSFDDYLRIVESGDRQEQEAFVNALTTNLTSFFREPHHFPILADHLKGLGGRRPLSIWCCAASTGEEPYSIAMTVVEQFGTFTPPVRILATDIDTSVLDRARQGIYRIDRIERLPREQLRRFFLRGEGKNYGLVRVRPELQKLITFRQLNLLDPQWPMGERFDAIFCRNVMIYFDKETQYGILRKFVPLLHPGGLLFAGHSESFHHAADLFQVRGKTVYAVRDGAPLPTSLRS
ncbi:chemotaxis protein CheR [Geobacter hydrogenophilus]|uniref:protein-glutamate O-methyltransferase n=1 Tax=Geobacter hydrogenophilus TaxID=40983 RepID=A0A9W6LA37_9BACT|nr:CheR family methyltransferase [Geobacter hydrogenophilus]MBT0895131.1 chemotaxis protein CheR [Geobacter hydrogenophilus]GLI36957.1 chemotaxis protein methyltransferase [Geobacter hydrogenophilus]